MTSQSSFKRLVRRRMDKTGESYMAARAALLAAAPAEPAQEAAPPVLATSDARIRERTGRGWEAWFDTLDAWGGAGQGHRELARRVAAELGVDPLAWAAQAVTTSYERARGGRAVGQHEDGFAVTATKTVGVPVEELFAAFAEPALRERWLPGVELRPRTATPPRRAHFDWQDGPSRVHVVLAAKDDGRSTASIEHARLADGAEAERMRAFWRERVAVLKAELER